MDELTIGDKIYISSKCAAAITGYAKDYVGQLCREGQVEAKMVGRSWYVLESSIRAHRFGKDDQPEQVQDLGDAGQDGSTPNGSEANGVVDPSTVTGFRDSTLIGTWERPTYAAEVAPVLPELTSDRVPGPTPEPDIANTRETPQSLDLSEERESLSEMQAAWKEWFENRQEPNVASVTIADSEAEDVSDESLEEVEQEIRETFEETQSVVSEAEAVPVAVHRIPDPRPVAIEMTPKTVAQAPMPADRPYDMGKTVVRKKRVRRRTSGPANLVYSALMVALAGIVIAIGLIGSGFADTYLGYNPIIEYLGGASSISK